MFLLPALLAACGGGGNNMLPPSQSPAPIPKPTPIQPNAKYVALGDSITYGLYATSVQTQAYPVIVAENLQAKLTNLGIPGEYSEGILSDEILKIPLGTQVITLFIGTNDEMEVASGTNSSSTVEQTFSSNMLQIASVLRENFPTASIYVANLPNMANMPAWKNADATTRATLSALNSALNSTIDQMGFPIVDLRCAPGAYDPSNYYNNGIGPLGDVHPNTQGHAYYASIFYATMTGSLWESHSCPYFTPQ